MTKWLLLLRTVGVLVGAWSFAAWLLQRRTKRYADDYIDARIKANEAQPRFTGFDPSLRERSEQLRRAANGIRIRAARVDSGARVAEVLRLSKGA